MSVCSFAAQPTWKRRCKGKTNFFCVDVQLPHTSESPGLIPLLYEKNILSAEQWTFDLESPTQAWVMGGLPGLL